MELGSSGYGDAMDEDGKTHTMSGLTSLSLFISYGTLRDAWFCC